MAKILIPKALAGFTDRQTEIGVQASTVGEAVQALAALYPDIQVHLFDEDGEVRSFINLFVGEENIKSLDGLDTQISETDTVLVAPAIAGGKGKGL